MAGGHAAERGEPFGSRRVRVVEAHVQRVGRQCRRVVLVQLDQRAGEIGAAGIDVELEPVETATFNATWQDPESAPLRLLTWRPLYDPYTLLSLVISNTGFLSRYDNPEAQTLIEAGATESDPEERDRIYRELGVVLRDSPAGIYLWSLTSFYGLDRDAPPWTPRADDWILPLVVEIQS